MAALAAWMDPELSLFGLAKMSYSAIMKNDDTQHCDNLKLAVSRNDITSTKRLLKGGVNVNTTFWYGNHLLHEAALNGSVEIVKLLLAAKADVNARNSEGRLPLHIACRSGNEEIVNLLLNANASLNAQTNDGRTCLHIALWRGHASVALGLIRRDININHLDSDLWTALHWATKMNMLVVVEKLLLSGCIVNATDKFGMTPLHVSFKCCSKRLVACLLKHGADVSLNKPTKILNMSTMTMLLKQRDCNPEVVRMLVQAGYNARKDKALLGMGVSGVHQIAKACRNVCPHVDVSSLACLCRASIRERLNDCSGGRSILDNITLLPLPQKLIQFLSFSDEFNFDT